MRDGTRGSTGKGGREFGGLSGVRLSGKMLLDELNFPARWWDAKGSFMPLIRHLPWEITCLSWSQLVTKLGIFLP